MDLSSCFALSNLSDGQDRLQCSQGLSQYHVMSSYVESVY